MMSEMLSFGYMQRALLAGVLIGTLCAIVGVYVILRGMSFIGVGVAHASFGGVALGFLLGINPLIAAALFCLLTAWGIGIAAQKGEIKEDTAIGVFFAFTMALGILFISCMRRYNVDLFGWLFGSIIAVTSQDIMITLILGGCVILIVALLFKELKFISFDSEMAKVTGLPSGFLYFLLLGLIALTVVVSIKVVGIILVSALIVTPAAAAYQLTERFNWMMALSIAIGVFSAVGGLIVSYWLDTPSGATIVILVTIIFFAASIFSPRRRRLSGRKEDGQDTPTRN